MSLDAIRWAWKQKIKPASMKLVLLSLCDRADEYHRCYPSIYRLHDDTGLDRKTIMSSIQKLVEAGILRVEKTNGTVSIYHLVGVEDKHQTSTNSGIGQEERTSTKNGTGPVPKLPPVPKTVPVPKTGHDQYQKRDTYQYQKRYCEPINEPIKNRNKEKTKKNTSQKIDLQNLPSEISETIAQAYIEHRKLIKKPLTQFAFDLAIKESLRAPEAGMTPEQLIEYSIRNGWQGINVDWAKNRTGKNGNGNKPLSAPERVAAAYAKKNAEKENAHRERNSIDLAKDDNGVWSPLDLQLRGNR